MIVKIGFTGTRIGLTFEQQGWLKGYLGQWASSNGTYSSCEFHHGDCIGADAEAHDIAKELGFDIVRHPPKDDKFRAFKSSPRSHFPKTNRIRNRFIVDSVEFMVAMPKNTKNIVRSGTWATIRYAKSRDKTLHIIYPSGVTFYWKEKEN